jgi:exoribonuclease II
LKFPKQQNVSDTSKTKIIPGAVVEYEQHGKPLLAIAQEEKNGKWYLYNEEGEELTLPSQRLYLYGEPLHEKNKAGLKKMSKDIKDAMAGIEIEKIWSGHTSGKNYSFDELFTHSGFEDTPLNRISLRRALIADRIYFKRSKEGFSSRTPEEVERSRAVRAENLAQESEKLALKLALQKKIMGDRKAVLPDAISFIEEVAAGSKKGQQAKIYHDLIEDMIRLSGIQLPKHTSIDQKAYVLLQHIEHFSEHQNLIPLRLGRPVTFSSEERQEAERLFQESRKETPPNREDLSDLEILTIDSESTEDFDDAISLEHIEDGYRVGIHITDASYRITRDSILEKAAFRRATSIYCPDQTIPMLPESLSEGVLSLKEDATRPALTFFVTLGLDYSIRSRKLVPSNIIVKERLSYEEVDKVLCDGKDHKRKSDLMILWDISSFHETSRIERGSLQFSRRDLVPHIEKNGKVRLVANNDETPARKLVSELMIVANETAALFASKQNIPFAYRTQDRPEGDIEKDAALIPDGPAREFFRRGCLKRSRTSIHPGPHAGLGLEAYCQITSPIRRALDLILQRQVLNFLATGTPLYSHEEIEQILGVLTPGLDEANLVQRERNRYWLLRYISQQKLKTFTGIIVRAEAPRPLAEIEVLGTTMPFTPVSPLQEGKNYSPLLGKTVHLKIRKLDHFQNKLYLNECETNN